MKENEKIRVKVEIAGVQYTLITDTSEVHLRKMASVVDELMSKNEESFPRLDQSKLAVLAAMQLADNNLILEKELQQVKDGQTDVTLSPEYRKLRDDHAKLRDDYAKLRTAYLELKQKSERPGT